MATTLCGISDSHGFHAAGGECLWALISNGKESILIYSFLGLVNGTEIEIDKNIMKTITSIKFLSAN